MKKGARPPGGARRVILSLLRRSTQGLLVTEVMELADCSESTAHKYLNALLREGLAKRIPAGGAAFRWFHRKVTDDKMVTTYKIRTKGVPENPKFTVEVEPIDLYNFLIKWQKPWQPKIFQSARNLPLGLARLYELGCEQAFGGIVSENDLDNVKLSIDQLRKDLEQTLRVVNGILDEPRIWDRHRFAQMTIANHDIDEIRSIAFKVKEAN